MFYRVADQKIGFSNTFCLNNSKWGKVRTVLVAYREETDSVVYMEVTTVVVEKGDLPGGIYLCKPTSEFPRIQGGILLVLSQLRWLRQIFAPDFCKNEGGDYGLGWAGMYRPGMDHERLFDLAEILPKVKVSWGGELLFPNVVVGQTYVDMYPSTDLAVLFSECTSFHMNHVILYVITTHFALTCSFGIFCAFFNSPLEMAAKPPAQLSRLHLRLQVPAKSQ